MELFNQAPRPQKKKRNRRIVILEALSKPGAQMTCLQLSRAVCLEEDGHERLAVFKNGAVNSHINKLVAAEEVCVAEAKGAMGGKVYQLKPKPNNQTENENRN